MWISIRMFCEVARTVEEENNAVILSQQLLEIGGRVCQHGLVGIDSCFQQLLARHIGLCVVDRVDGDELAVPEVPDGMRAFAGAGAQKGFVVAEVEAGDLQLHVILIGPEPRLRVIGRVTAGDDRSGGFSLVDGILHRFESYPPILPGLHGAIAGGKDRRVRGAGELVDEDAVRNVKTGFLGQLVVRHDADADDGEIDLDHRSVRKLSAANMPIPADETLKPGLFADHDIMALVDRADDIGRFLGGNALENAVGHFDDGHFEAAIARNGCRFETDITAAV